MNSPIIRSLIKSTKSSNNELVLTVVGDPISEEELETIRQKQASYGIQSVQIESQAIQQFGKIR